MTKATTEVETRTRPIYAKNVTLVFTILPIC